MTIVEHCEQAETIDNIAVANFSVSEEDSDTKSNKKRSRFKEREENGKKRHNKNASLYCFLHDETKLTPLGSAMYSMQRLKTNTFLSIQKSNTTRSSKK